MRFLKDLLFTDLFLIKGHINTGDQRLSTYLNQTPKGFLEIEEAILIKHDGSARISARQIHMRINDILFAYEMEVTGDAELRRLGERAKNDVEVIAYLSGNTSLQFSGRVRKRSLDSDLLPHHDFIVVVDPKFSGFNVSASNEHALFESLPYIIVNKNRLSFICPQ
jgi:hypothetical protein